MNKVDSELYADKGKADRHRSTQDLRTFVKMKTQKIVYQEKVRSGHRNNQIWK